LYIRLQRYNVSLTTQTKTAFYLLNIHY